MVECAGEEYIKSRGPKQIEVLHTRVQVVKRIELHSAFFSSHFAATIKYLRFLSSNQFSPPLGDRRRNPTWTVMSYVRYSRQVLLTLGLPVTFDTPTEILSPALHYMH